jgi:hypothetical protein
MAAKSELNGKTKLPTGFVWRGDKISIRKPWPVEVTSKRPLLAGKCFQKSLKTADPREAQRQAIPHLAEFHRLCAEYVTLRPPANAMEWIYSLPDGDVPSALDGHFNLAQLEMAKGYATQLPPLVAVILPDDAKARVIAFRRSRPAQSSAARRHPTSRPPARGPSPGHNA